MPPSNLKITVYLAVLSTFARSRPSISSRMFGRVTVGGCKPTIEGSDFSSSFIMGTLHETERNVR
jgi:hypothetical protein